MTALRHHGETRAMSREIWVLVETLRGEVSEITYTMLGVARALADELGLEVRALLLGHGAETLAGSLGVADRLTIVDHPALADFNPSAWLPTVGRALEGRDARLLLLGHTTVGMDLVGGLAARMDCPTVASCRCLRAADGAIEFESLVYGGKLVATGTVPAPLSLVTVIPGGVSPDAGRAERAPEIERVEAPPGLDELATTMDGFVEPDAEDIDISREDVLVSVGRGLQQEENLELARALAEALGGEVCASRPIVDQGWLPATRLVGKSGKQVRPKVYLALGVSGAPEHLEGIGACETLVAINTDERAPIFELARFGATVDVLDLLPVLTERLRESATTRGGS